MLHEYNAIGWMSPSSGEIWEMIAAIAYNRAIVVEMCQDGCLCEGIFEGFEWLGVVRAPCEWGILACEV